MNTKNCFLIIAILMIGCTNTSPVEEHTLEQMDAGDSKNQQALHISDLDEPLFAEENFVVSQEEEWPSTLPEFMCSELESSFSAAIQTNHLEGNKCRQDLVFRAGYCWCGEIALAPIDSEQWDCIDGTHYLCLRQDGCASEDSIFPVWTYWGKHDSSFDRAIPTPPKNAKGYRLELGRENKYHWICREEACACGKGRIRDGIECLDDTFLPSGNRNCGKETCYIGYNHDWLETEGPYGAMVCRDGLCMCGDTWQGWSPEKYNCTYRTNDWGTIELDSVCENESELCKFLKKQQEQEHHPAYICETDALCSCGEGVCVKGAECRNDRCYCGDLEISEFEDYENYHCQHDSSNDVMICVSDDGCLCGDHRVIKGAGCVEGKQYCHRIFYDWLDEAVVSQYACDEIHPMIICNDPEGCACGDNMCMKGTSCIDGKCICGNKMQLDAHVAAHPEDYICKDGEYVCNLPEGCECGEKKCIKGAICKDNMCECGEYEDVTTDVFVGMACVHDGSTDTVVPACYNCGGYRCGCRRCKRNTHCYGKENYAQRDSKYTLECLEHVDHGKYCYINKDKDNKMVDYSDSTITIGNNRYYRIEKEDSFETTIASCRDCDQFTLYEYSTEEPPYIRGIYYKCKINGGCNHLNKHYQYNEEFYKAEKTTNTIDAETGKDEVAENLPPEQIKVQEECQMAQGRAVYHHEVDNEESGRIEISYHVENHTCLCGDSEVPVAEVKDYICDMNIHWRCNREDGCACGDVRCKRSQICLAPGVCSQ